MKHHKYLTKKDIFFEDDEFLCIYLSFGNTDYFRSKFDYYKSIDVNKNNRVDIYNNQFFLGIEDKKRGKFDRKFSTDMEFVTSNSVSFYEKYSDSILTSDNILNHPIIVEFVKNFRLHLLVNSKFQNLLPKIIEKSPSILRRILTKEEFIKVHEENHVTIPQGFDFSGSNSERVFDYYDFDYEVIYNQYSLLDRYFIRRLKNLKGVFMVDNTFLQIDYNYMDMLTRFQTSDRLEWIWFNDEPVNNRTVFRKLGLDNDKILFSYKRIKHNDL